MTEYNLMPWLDRHRVKVSQMVIPSPMRSMMVLDGIVNYPQLGQCFQDDHTTEFLEG